MQLHVLVRSRNEPFIHEFVEHYLYEGVDKIHIIDDSDDLSSYEAVVDCPQVNIITTLHRRDPKEALHIAYEQIKDQADWLLVVDADEFVTTRRDPDSTLRNELLTTFTDADYVKIPWVMMSFNGQEHNPDSLLVDNVWRWDHDRRRTAKVHKFRCRYSEIEVKSLFRPSKFGDSRLTCHGLTDLVDGSPTVVDSVLGLPANIDFFYQNLREESISNAHLVCQHYRFASVDHVKSKFDGNLFYAYSAFDLIQVLESDGPELRDTLLRDKTLKRRGL